VRKLLLAAAALILAVGASGCGGDDEAGGTTETTATAASGGCDKGQLELVKPGKLTIGTDNPAFPPWFDGGSPKGSKWEINDPSTGKGFESAVAYAVAGKLGFAKNEVQWTVVPFNNSFKPGPKDFDFDINQISVTDARERAVDFSDSYYDVNQALVARKGTPIANAKSIDDLKQYKLGAQIGTTSLGFIQDEIDPSGDPRVYDTSNDVVSALNAKQIDGVVVDLPTAFFLVGAEEVKNGVVVGQFEGAGGEQEHFGMLFEEGNALRDCVNDALSKLKDEGTLDRIQQEWLSEKASAPVLK
jgi:polar amino acid transport system substrate-binding protein